MAAPKHSKDIPKKGASKILTEDIKKHSYVELDNTAYATVEHRSSVESRRDDGENINQRDSTDHKKEHSKENDDQRDKWEKIALKRMQSKDDKSKTLVDLELGEGIKGKVKQMIYKMNSCENLQILEERKEVIRTRERPRRSSVSEKIALFERKLSPVSMENPMSQEILPSPVRVEIRSKSPTREFPSTEEYVEEIKELKNATIVFGKFNEIGYVTFKNGGQMPNIALGTALLDQKLTPHVVAAAIDLGYRAVDAAFVYGNEEAVGKGIKAKIDDGTVRREELFIINKLWSTFHRPDLVEAACRASLQAMGLEYFDLYLIHNPMSFKEGNNLVPKIANVVQYSQYDYMHAWFAMEKLVRKGLVKNIGVSNFNSEQIAKVFEKSKIKPVVNQVECHPYLTQQRLGAFCEARGVKLMCFGTLGSKGTPKKYRQAQAVVLDDPVVEQMAKERQCSKSQVLTKYQLLLGHGVVVKSSSPLHLWKNLSATKTNLTDHDVATLNELNKNARTYAFIGMGDTHKNYPFKAPF